MIIILVVILNVHLTFHAYSKLNISFLIFNVHICEYHSKFIYKYNNKKKIINILQKYYFNTIQSVANEKYG